MPSRHQYGPDQAELAPNSVTVLTPAAYSCGRQHRHGPDCRVTRWPVPEVRPLPAALVRQRQQLNALAHELGQAMDAKAAAHVLAAEGLL